MDQTTPDHVVRQKFRSLCAFIVGTILGLGLVSWLIYAYHSVWNTLVVLFLVLCMVSGVGALLKAIWYLLYYSTLRTFVMVKKRLADDIKVVGG